ncbi:MAG: M1 family aminopeptidase [Flavobacterium sp.]|uniref:M1 family aminopeptidase n=1 Tax=Flavobacterium sp. TaxID=239 RepID=UPI0022CAB488|nr:M1 family aminopeptidase [Flavobacterium sp.]MCZ8196311.1 M1 family aminopeptidase [Flavobacterium sp.]
MKKYYLLILVLTSVFSYAQTDIANKEIEEIANIEMKSASKIINFVANPNTANYDLTYHKLEFTVDPSNYYIAGKVISTYTALANMSTVTFDLSSELTVSSVKKNNLNLTFSQNTNNELIITLPSVQATGTSATVEITYEGAPPSSGFGSFEVTTHAGQPVMWTLSEPFGAMEWWPCKQDLNDKINSIDVFITAPTALVAVSNGMQQAKVNNGDGTSTTHFQHNYPIPAYLIAIAVTNYSIYNQQAGLGTIASPFFPIVNYLYPEAASASQADLSVTPAIMNFFEATFVPYPFRAEKYGHAQFGWGGGMEHTTVSFMGGFDRGLIAHEMAHQWFGDKVTCGDWKDIWLNEGFATYLATMVIEHLDGEAAFISDKNTKINSITSQTGGSVYVPVSDQTNVNRIFSGRLSYNKGAMVVNMLRLKLGTTNFLQALRNYLTDVDLAYNYAVTPDLKEHLEAVSGLDLTEFFNDWVYGQGYPIYAIQAGNSSPGMATIIVNQTQSHPSVSYFEGQVPVRLTGSGGQQQDYILNNTVNGENFQVSVPFNVTGVVFNPKKDIISKNSTAVLANESFELDSKVSIYPNPASTELNIQIPSNVSLEAVVVYNALGQNVFESKSAIIDVNSLSTGVYSLKITTSEGLVLKKFIKK